MLQVFGKLGHYHNGRKQVLGGDATEIEYDCRVRGFEWCCAPRATGEIS